MKSPFRTLIVTDEQALLNAIRDRPGDTLPRLVFADWLDERGRDAEAVVMRSPRIDWLFPALFRPDLLAAVRRRVLAGLPRGRRVQIKAADARDPVTADTLYVDHGAVEVVECVPNFWRRYGRKLVAAQPVREVRFVGVEPLRTVTRSGMLANGWDKAEAWAVSTGSRFPAPSNLPGWLYAALPRRSIFGETDGPAWKGLKRVYYRSEAAALADLSAAALGWARSALPVPTLSA